MIYKYCNTLVWYQVLTEFYVAFLSILHDSCIKRSAHPSDNFQVLNIAGTNMPLECVAVLSQLTNLSALNVSNMTLHCEEEDVCTGDRLLQHIAGKQD